jgi:hypothetical protein
MVQSHVEAVLQNAVSDGPSKEHTTENKRLQAVYFTVMALLRVSHATVKCHRLCMCQLNNRSLTTIPVLIMQILSKRNGIG